MPINKKAGKLIPAFSITLILDATKRHNPDQGV